MKTKPSIGTLLRATVAGFIGIEALLSNSLSTKAQSASNVLTPPQSTNIVVNFSGTVSGIAGTGNGIVNGSLVNGSITFNLSDLLLGAGDGQTQASVYSDASAIVSCNINGNVSTFQGIIIDVFNNDSDYSSYNVTSDSFFIGWGPGYSDGVAIAYPASTINDTTVISLETVLNKGLSGSLVYSGDASFNVGYDTRGWNGGYGNLTSFQRLVPTVSMIQQGGNIVLSWSTNYAAGFTMCCSTGLDAVAAWTTITNAPVQANTLAEFLAKTKDSTYSIPNVIGPPPGGSNYFLSLPKDPTPGAAHFFKLFSGTLPTPPAQITPPTLSISQTASTVSLTWPTNYSTFKLLSSPFIGTKSSWTPITNAPSLLGTNYCVRLPKTPGGEIFRLSSAN